MSDPRPIDVVTEALARRGIELRGDPANGVMVCCSAHDDRTPSLSVTEKPDGTVLLHCFADCTTQEVLGALGLHLLDLFPTKTSNRDNVVAYYDYETTPPMRVVRTVDKDFYQQHQRPDGSWVKGIKDVLPPEARVIYRRAEVRATARAGGTIYVTEGEKDTDAVREKGETATTNPMGAGCWLDQYAADFEGASKVIVVADKDEEGYRHAGQVAASLRSVVDDVVIVQAVEGKDAFDHLAAGHGVDDFDPVIDVDHPPSVLVWERAPDPFVIAPLKWLVRGLWCEGTHGELAGPEKTLKSYVGMILDVGLAAGVPVLGKFEVDVPRRVACLVGEGGRWGYWRRFGRVCDAYGVPVADVRENHEVTFNTARFGSALFVDAMRQQLEDFGPALIHPDPYYAYAPSGGDSFRLNDVGAALEEVGSLCAAYDTTLLINNHFNETGTGTRLTRITGAGHAEWVDSWLMLTHRQPGDVAGGRFWLRLDVGSRQWGGSSWDLDLDIGRYDEIANDHVGQITWSLSRATGPADPQVAYDAKIDAAKLALLRVARGRRKPFTKTQLVKDTVGQEKVLGLAFDRLVVDQQVVLRGTTAVAFGRGTRQVETYVVAP